MKLPVYLKIVIKSISIFIEFFLAFISSYLTISLFSMSVSVGETSSQNDLEIYMKSDGIHTDFVFPVKTDYFDWKTIFFINETKGKDSTKTHISIGWGDQGFFLNTPEWSDLKFSTAFNAAFYRGKSAIHINYINVKDFQSDFRLLKISKEEYQLICKYVFSSLRKNSKNRVICIPNKGYWETDSFYEANGRYGLFNTCNSWINSGLKSADLKACLWTPFNSGIFSKYSK